MDVKGSQVFMNAMNAVHEVSIPVYERFSANMALTGAIF